ncbi:MAG: SAM-dependent methyltransferase [Gammaproteobacteria bacterium]|nr:SAM-dependent methyltransferase [Gammaproteobacteria bacterium]
MKHSSTHETRRRLGPGCSDTDILIELIGRWFRSPQGQSVWAAEKAITEQLIARLFGYHILQIGCHEEFSLVENSPVGHKVMFRPAYAKGSTNPVALGEELPVANDIVDVVVLHHALDFTEQTHRLLREATRVLRPGGHMLIVGFNPASLWGICRLLRSRQRVPWNGKFISRGRLSDWLQLLNLQLESSALGLYSPPTSIAKVLTYASRIEKLGTKIQLPFGGVYILQCVKQITPITPIVPRWRPLRSGSLGVPAAENVRVTIH